MATVIDFATRRPKVAAVEIGNIFSFPNAGKLRIASNPRNRYDAAFKGMMTKRAEELCTALHYVRTAGSQDKREAIIDRLVREIRAIRDEVARTTPEHHRPDDAETSAERGR